MLSEFEVFLTRWRTLAMKSGRFELPARADITITEFHAFLPKMTIARWDMEAVRPKLIYCGAQLDALVHRNVQNSPLKALFEPGPFIAQHLEIAMKVIHEHVGAEVRAELTTGGARPIPVSQLRLPLAPDEGMPVIMSLFSFPEAASSATGTEKATVKNMEHRYIDLQGDSAKSVAG